MTGTLATTRLAQKPRKIPKAAFKHHMSVDVIRSNFCLWSTDTSERLQLRMKFSEEEEKIGEFCER